jgi:hypothetical protein
MAGSDLLAYDRLALFGGLTKERKRAELGPSAVFLTQFVPSEVQKIPFEQLDQKDSGISLQASTLRGGAGRHTLLKTKRVAQM